MGSVDEYENVIFHIGPFINLKKLQLGFKTSTELVGVRFLAALRTWQTSLFYSVAGVQHENIAMFSALDAKIILMSQCVFACLFNG